MATSIVGIVPVNFSYNIIQQFSYKLATKFSKFIAQHREEGGTVVIWWRCGGKLVVRVKREGWSMSAWYG